jgi:hypothetical protein
MNEREKAQLIVSAHSAIHGAENEFWVSLLDPVRISNNVKQFTVEEMLRMDTISWAFAAKPHDTAKVLWGMANDENLDPENMDQMDVNFEFLCAMNERLT